MIKLRLLIVGCEYAGKTTFKEQFTKWWNNLTGAHVVGHDHFTFYGTGSNGADPLVPPSDELEKLKALAPKIKRQLQRNSIYYHLGAEWPEGFADWIVVGFHIEEVVYAPLYYGYDREGFAYGVDYNIRKYFPRTFHVLVTASSDKIAERMNDNPHSDNVIKKQDIEVLLKRFKEEFNRSLVGPKFILDTTDQTPKETLNQFIKAMMPHLSQKDILRIQNHQSFGRPNQQNS